MPVSLWLRLRESVRSSPGRWVALLALGVTLLWAFGSALTGMSERWAHDSRYSHGWLVPLFAGYLLYSRRKHLDSAGAWQPSWLGVPLVLAGLGLHAAG